MTSDDLRHLFDAVAAEATDTVALDEEQLLPRIRRKRRRRFMIAGLCGATAATVLAAGAYAARPDTGGEGNVAAPATRPGPTVQPSVPSGCGASIHPRFPLESWPAMQGVKLIEQKLTRSPTGWSGTLRFTANNPRSLDAIHEVSSFSVTQAHTVVGTAQLAVAKPLSRSFEAHLTIRSCESAKPTAAASVLVGKMFQARYPITFIHLKLPAQ